MLLTSSWSFGLELSSIHLFRDLDVSKSSPILSRKSANFFFAGECLGGKVRRRMKIHPPNFSTIRIQTVKFNFFEISLPESILPVNLLGSSRKKFHYSLKHLLTCISSENGGSQIVLTRKMANLRTSCKKFIRHRLIAGHLVFRPRPVLKAASKQRGQIH